jgi:hypothetical protein
VQVVDRADHEASEAVAAAMEAEVEVSSEVVEVDIDVDEPTMTTSAPQGLSYSSPPAELEVVGEEETYTDTGTTTNADELAFAQPANELEEPAPSSSPRPIELPGNAYEEELESAPRHTPPPESGKQVAAVPSAHPPPLPKRPSVPIEAAPDEVLAETTETGAAQSDRPSELISEPPASLEGHTLIGGWREPGLGGPMIGVGAVPAMGVRVPAPPASAVVASPPPTTPHPPQGPQSPPIAQAGSPPPSARLSPETTQPNLPTSANVAVFQGQAPSTKPASFGDLLDWTLSL